MPVLELHQLPVLVGVDGSASSRAALRWAYREAARAGAPLQVLTAWPSVSRGAGAIETEEQARAVAIRAVNELPAGDVDVDVIVSPYPDETADVLLRRTHRSSLLVVGPHSRHSLHERVLGTVTEHVLADSDCPVAVVPVDAGDAPATHRLVVGVDGTPPSIAALRWAVHRAIGTDSKVEALLVWDWRPEYGVYPFGPDERQQQAHAEAALARGVIAVPEDMRDVIRSEVVRGHAADVLVAAGDHADALVVGNTRCGHVASHLLGSVSRKVALSARVPVIVTHERHLPGESG